MSERAGPAPHNRAETGHTFTHQIDANEGAAGGPRPYFPFCGGW